MAGKIGNKNAVGNSGGKSLQDRKLAASVRNLTLKKIQAVLEAPIEKMKKAEYELYKAILIKLAGSILPRLNEHTGDDGDPIRFSLSEEQANRILKRKFASMQAGRN